MKTLTFAGQEYKAERIEKISDAITGYNGDEVVFAFRGVSDFSAFLLDGGWDEPQPTLDQVVQAQAQARKILDATQSAVDMLIDLI